jgi:hypothetical protein
VKKETKAQKALREQFYEAVLATAYLYEEGCWFSKPVKYQRHWSGMYGTECPAAGLSIPGSTGT